MNLEIRRQLRHELNRNMLWAYFSTYFYHFKQNYFLGIYIFRFGYCFILAQQTILSPFQAGEDISI